MVILNQSAFLLVDNMVSFLYFYSLDRSDTPALLPLYLFFCKLNLYETDNIIPFLMENNILR